MSSKNDEKSGHNFDLDLLTILNQLHVSHPKGSGLVWGGGDHLRPSTLFIKARLLCRQCPGPVDLPTKKRQYCPIFLVCSASMEFGLSSQRYD